LRFIAASVVGVDDATQGRFYDRCVKELAHRVDVLAGFAAQIDPSTARRSTAGVVRWYGADLRVLSFE
jgi:hypothetical protein